jgi:cytochrome c oxidase subunit 2
VNGLVRLLHLHLSGAASDGALAVDRALEVALTIGVAAFVLFLGALVVVLVRRQRAPVPDTSDATGFSTFGYILWCSVSLGVVSFLFWQGYVPYLDALVAPGDAFEIQAVSHQGSWTFSYPTGKVSLNKLVVPNRRPVRLVLSSTDVPHGFFVPQLRTQRTALPGRYSSLWFTINDVQEFSILSKQDCPPRRDASPATIAVVDSARFDEWLAARDKRVASVSAAQ